MDRHDRFKLLDRVGVNQQEGRPGERRDCTVGEYLLEMSALWLFDGRGAVRLIESDGEREVMLLERLEPGTLLSTLEDDAEATARTYPRQARTPFNVTGHPALAMRSGLSATGLPLSVQFVGRYFGEPTVLRVAAAWERASGGPHQPPLD